MRVPCTPISFEGFIMPVETFSRGWKLRLNVATGLFSPKLRLSSMEHIVCATFFFCTLSFLKIIKVYVEKPSFESVIPLCDLTVQCLWRHSDITCSDYDVIIGARRSEPRQKTRLSNSPELLGLSAMYTNAMRGTINALTWFQVRATYMLTPHPSPK